MLWADVVSSGATIRRAAAVADSVLDGRFEPQIALAADSHILETKFLVRSSESKDVEETLVMLIIP